MQNNNPYALKMYIIIIINIYDYVFSIFLFQYFNRNTVKSFFLYPIEEKWIQYKSRVIHLYNYIKRRSLMITFK